MIFDLNGRQYFYESIIIEAEINAFFYFDVKMSCHGMSDLIKY